MKKAAVILAAITCGGCAATARGQEAPSVLDFAVADADGELLQSWSAVAEMIAVGEPWGACRRRLAEAVDEYSSSQHAVACRALVASLLLAEQRPAGVRPVAPGASLAECVAALPEARVPYTAVHMPHQYHSEDSQHEWDYLQAHADGADTNPAYLLFRFGRPALPALLPLLDDRTATRSVVPTPVRFSTPQVYRVCDLALSLIEGISGCTFRGQGHRRGALSSFAEKDRAATIADVRAWATATKDAPFAEAVLWQARRSKGTPRETMLAGLITRGHTVEALAFLQETYAADGRLNYGLAQQMVRAGSREPLDWIHRAIDTGEPLDQTMVRLIAQVGERRDFALIGEVVQAAGVARDRATVQQMIAIVNTMLRVDRPDVVPVFVGVVEWELAYRNGHPDAESLRVVDFAAARIQDLTGLSFGLGLDSDVADDRRVRQWQELIAWWYREGCGAYGFAQTERHAPGGIR